MLHHQLCVFKVRRRPDADVIQFFLPNEHFEGDFVELGSRVYSSGFLCEDRGGIQLTLRVDALDVTLLFVILSHVAKSAVEVKN